MTATVPGRLTESKILVPAYAHLRGTCPERRLGLEFQPKWKIKFASDLGISHMVPIF
jgi:hypothetical protein